MNMLNLAKRFVAGAVIAVTGLVMTGSVVQAIPYTGPNTPNSPVPAFNVFTGVPSVGNESDFLRARVDDGSTTDYSDPLNNACADNTKMQLRVYVHNGASTAGNQGGSGPSVAHGTKVAVSVPGNEAASFSPSATISATNAATVNDNVTINCNGRKVKMTYVPGSASSFSLGTGVVPLSDAIVTTGVPIRSQSVPGDVWGCWDDRVYVVLSVTVKAVPETPPSLGVCKAVDFVVEQDKRKVTVNKVTADLTNATVVGHKIEWGDGTMSSKETDSHTYAKDGTYNVVVSVLVKFADGHTEWKTASGCKKQVTFKTNIPPTTPPVTPTTLPDTGAGSIVGIFTATTAVGAFVHRYILSRRSS